MFVRTPISCSHQLNICFSFSEKLCDFDSLFSSVVHPFVGSHVAHVRRCSGEWRVGLNIWAYLILWATDDLWSVLFVRFSFFALRIAFVIVRRTRCSDRWSFEFSLCRKQKWNDDVYFMTCDDGWSAFFEQNYNGRYRYTIFPLFFAVSRWHYAFVAHKTAQTKVMVKCATLYLSVYDDDDDDDDHRRQRFGMRNNNQLITYGAFSLYITICALLCDIKTSRIWHLAPKWM